jgi:dihydrolipoamide dehydrogenase
MGGTCLNRGCIPSKMLIHHADIVETVKSSEKFHIDAEVKDIEFSEIVNEVNKKVSEDAENIEKGIKNSENHTLYKTEAEFVDEKTLKVNDEKITAEKIFVAAGTRPMVPPIPGMEKTDYLTSKETLKLDECPDEMIIIGGGYISVEMAHFFDTMGTEITIIEMTDSLVNREDHDIQDKFTEIAEQKYNVELGLKAAKVQEIGDKIKVTAIHEDETNHSFSADELLVAAGRVPNTDKLDVEAAEIETDDRGFIETGEFMETNIGGVYAIGDIAGNYMFKHSANLEAENALINAFKGNSREINYAAMPHAIFSSPQIAGVGKTEQELDNDNADYVKAIYEYKNTGMGMALKEEDGFVKVLAAEDGEILGCHIIGPDASQLIHEVLVSIKHGSGYVQDIQDTVHIHPALNEVVQRAFNQI